MISVPEIMYLGFHKIDVSKGNSRESVMRQNHQENDDCWWWKQQVWFGLSRHLIHPFLPEMTNFLLHWSVYPESFTAWFTSHCRKEWVFEAVPVQTWQLHLWTWLQLPDFLGERRYRGMVPHLLQETLLLSASELAFLIFPVS